MENCSTRCCMIHFAWTTSFVCWICSVYLSVMNHHYLIFTVCFHFFHNCCQTGPPQAQPTNPQFEHSHHRKKRRTSERLKNQCDLDDGSSERQNIAWLSQPAACAADGFCMVLLILLLFGRCSVVLLEEEPGNFCWNLVSSCVKEATSHATLSGALRPMPWGRDQR